MTSGHHVAGRRAPLQTTGHMSTQGQEGTTGQVPGSKGCHAKTRRSPEPTLPCGPCTLCSIVDCVLWAVDR